MIINIKEYSELYNEQEFNNGIIISSEILHTMVSSLGYGTMVAKMLHDTKDLFFSLAKDCKNINDKNDITNILVEIDYLTEFIENII